ncbi:MAG: M14 family zinc carboxypeptidase [Fimbriimonadaceae bacterium]
MRPILLLSLALCSARGFAQNDLAYGAKIREYTTEPFFLTDLVDHLPESAKVPSPMKHFGDIVGAPNNLHHVDQINAYMRALDQASNRIVVRSMGKSEDGREMIVVIISDEANLKRLDRISEINDLLGDPRKLGKYRGDGNLTDADGRAESLQAEGLPIYYATAGMHSPESGPPEMLMELAYRLAVEETPFIRDIRKNSVVMLTPVLDVDGRDRYVDTYLYRKKNPTKPPVPLLYWGQYVAHDNNRDNVGMGLALSKNLVNTWLQYHPTVLHDLHESVPFLYISTGTGPYNAWLDPITIDEWHMMAYNEVDEMTKRGVPGVWTHGFYDGWAPNYAFYIANGHNAIGRFYETQGGSGADTRVITVGEQSQRQWFRPNPPLSSVRWSLRNNTNLMQSGVLLGMHNLAMNRVKFLQNYYLKSKRSVLKPWNEGPAAYVLSAKKGREWNLGELKTLMNRQGVEVSYLTEDFGGQPKGSVVVRMDQPYCRMADMLLDKQFYRADDPSPYDDTGWTLGPLFDVNWARVTDKAILNKTTPTEPAKWAENKAFPIDKSKLGRVALVHTWQSTQDEGWVRMAFEAAGVPYTYISTHDLRDTADLKSKFDVIILSPTGGSAQSIVNGVAKEGEAIPWKALEGFPHLGGPTIAGVKTQTDNIRGGIELQGMLNLQRFLNEGGLFVCLGDTCSVPIQYGLVSGVSITEPKDLFAPGGVFLAENAIKTNPIMATYDDTVGVYFSQTPLLSLGGGGFGGGQGASRTSRPSGRGDLNDPDIVQGRPPHTAKSQPGDSAAPTPQPQGPRPQVLLRFAAADKLLISGALDKGEELAGKAAVIQCPVGKGNVLLFAINPMWRQSTQGSWAMIFNAAANWQGLR